mgnify:CR=1 FL=1
MEAQAAGYDFDLDFYPVTEGKADKKSVKGSTLLKEDDLKVLIVKDKFRSDRSGKNCICIRRWN